MSAPAMVRREDEAQRSSSSLVTAEPHGLATASNSYLSVTSDASQLEPEFWRADVEILSEGRLVTLHSSQKTSRLITDGLPISNRC